MTSQHAFLQEISSTHTRRAYRVDLSRFFGEAEVDDHDLETVTTEDIRAFVRVMYEKGRSESTQRRRIAALRRFFDWLIDEGIRETNPVRSRGVTPMPPDGRDTSTTVLGKQDVRSMIEAARDRPRSRVRDQALMLTIVYGALRRGEVAGLRAKHVRPLGRYWIIDLPTSTSTSGGYVRIPDLVVDAIETMKSEFEIDEGPLWRSVSNRNRGEPMSPDAIYKAVRSLGKDAGLDGVNIDVLRRTGLQLALEGGADLPTVQVHGRFKAASSVAALHEEDDASGTLRKKNAADFIDLDRDDLIQTE